MSRFERPYSNSSFNSRLQVDSLDRVEELSHDQKNILYQLQSDLNSGDFLGSPSNLDSLKSASRTLTLTRDHALVSTMGRYAIIDLFQSLKGIKDAIDADISPDILSQLLDRASLESIPEK